MPAVIYARYSSDMQREESIEAQVRACKYYAQQENLDVIRIYTDRAKSGMYHSEQRAEFKRMLQDAPLGEFDTVLVHKLNRFGRAGVKALNDREHLEKHGINIISVTERLENTPEGRLMLFVITGMNEYYSRNLAAEVLKGMRENAYKGISTGGKPALGYNWQAEAGADAETGQSKRTTKKLVINPREAEAVRLIFNRYASGAGYGDIISELNKNGYVTKRGLPFGKNSIYEILHNERYTGCYTYGKTHRKNGTRNNHKKSDDYIKVEGGCPQIIDMDLWERVQKMLEIRRRTRASNKAKTLYALTGVLYCGECGRAMCGKSRTARGVRYTYYSCNTKTNGKDCCMPDIPQEKLEASVFDTLNSVAFSDEYITRMAQKMYASYADENTKTEHLAKELQQIENKLANIAKAVAGGMEFDELTNEATALRQRKIELHEQIVLLEERPDDRLSVDELKSFLLRFANIKNMPPENKREVVRLYVDKVTLKWQASTSRYQVSVSLNPNNIDMDAVHITGAGEGT